MPITLLVLIGSVGIALLPALYVGRMRDLLTRTEERLQTTAWQLERLVPKQASAGEAAEPDEEEPPRSGAGVGSPP